MKRSLLAIAIPALLIAGSASASIEIWNKDGNKVDFKGRVKALNKITDRNQDKEGDHTNARIGFIGETQITNDLTGYGRWEWETKAGHDAKNETRYAFVGLNFGDFGSFDYGRNDGVLKALTAYTDVLPEFGGDAADNSIYTLSGRTKAVATYRNNNLFGLTDDISFALQYADNGDNSNDDGKSESSEAYGANVQWNIFDTGLTAGAGYAHSTDVKTWAAGVKYDGTEHGNNLYLGANYFQSKFDDVDFKIKGVELVAQYGLDLEVGRLTPSLAYVQHKFNDEDEYLQKYVSLGATYALNKNFSTIVEYQFNLLDKDDWGAANRTKNAIDKDGDLVRSTKPGTKDVLAVGLIYQF